jgi:4-hydroxy-2-oxoheptanedioate aldolase
MTAFKDRLAQGKPLLGLWQALANGYTADICARAGYDWLLFDGEHAPNTPQTLLAQLQAVTPFPPEAIARVPSGDPVCIKQYLDIGFTTLLVPMVDSAAQAAAVVSACRYPPHGIRGVASATARATGYGLDRAYLAEVAQRVTVIVQIESRAALDDIDAIAATDGVDALFIGPADLSASLGHLGNPGHEDVQAAISHAKARIDAAQKPAGIFALSPADAKSRIEEGFRFVSIGTDIGLLLTGARGLLEAVRK